MGLWFGLVYLLNARPNPYGLFNAEIWFICKCLINDLLQSFFLFNYHCDLLLQIHGIEYSYLVLMIHTQLYVLKLLFLFDNNLFALTYMLSSIPI